LVQTAKGLPTRLGPDRKSLGDLNEAAGAAADRQPDNS
jgi:hypothetical protein